MIKMISRLTCNKAVDRVSAFCVILAAGILCCFFQGVAEEDSISSDYVVRFDYKEKLEPKGNCIIHGAGRLSPTGWEDFDSYADLMIDRAPAITVAWIGLKDSLNSFFSSLDAHLANHSNMCLIPQIGLMLNAGEEPNAHYEDAVARGELDEQINVLGEYLERLDRPVYLRIGFAFNGEWNNYNPETYKQAYRRIWEMLTAKDSLRNNVAFVWCYSPAAADRRFEEYYPGDELVDWWALDIFGVLDVARENTEQFLKSAEAHGKPVMISEATPLGFGVQTETAWERWFAPFFKFIKSNPGIKAVCYINRNWCNYDRWKAWGDCRLQNNAALAVKYYHEIGNAVWLHDRLMSAHTELTGLH